MMSFMFFVRQNIAIFVPRYLQHVCHLDSGVELVSIPLNRMLLPKMHLHVCHSYLLVKPQGFDASAFPRAVESDRRERVCSDLRQMERITYGAHRKNCDRATGSVPIHRHSQK